VTKAKWLSEKPICSQFGHPPFFVQPFLANENKADHFKSQTFANT
jgi:hypothetical protein